ncbi:MAG: alpha/beta hydrolase [Burkholderiaceae bacterium]|nr:alpha/beta hydrolase [Burkholderiaceae bacterium]
MPHDYQRVSVRGTALAYVERGDGAPVVLLHGSGTTDLRTFGAQMAPFAERHRTIAYSRRCHHPNAWVDDGTDLNDAAVHAADLAALLDALGLSRVHVVGVSFGADVALRFAVDQPQRVRSLTVAEPALFGWLVELPGGAELFEAYAARLRPAQDALAHGQPQAALQRYVDAFMGEGAFEQLPAAVHDRMTDNLRMLALEPSTIDAIGVDITRDEAAALHLPALVLTGQDSPHMFLRTTDELVRCLPRPECVRIADASHLLHVMNPAAFNAAVLAFIDKRAL